VKARCPHLLGLQRQLGRTAGPCSRRGRYVVQQRRRYRQAFGFSLVRRSTGARKRSKRHAGVTGSTSCAFSYGTKRTSDERPHSR
jgi:hypothetical protein